MNAAHHEVLEAARQLQPTLLSRAEEIEQSRRIPKDISNACADAGFYRLMIPEACDGLELPPRISLEIFEILATADASTAWCCFIAATSGTMLASLSPDAARAIYSSRRTSLAGVFAPMGIAHKRKGGFIVNGHWQWGSHSQNADWIAGGCRLFRDGEPYLSKHGSQRQHMMLAPVSEVSFSDTWHASGLCGTGSTDFTLSDVFVPAEHAVGYQLEQPLERPLYLFPHFGLLALGIAGVSLGIARAAIDELISLAGAKTPQGSARTLANRPTTQANVSRAEALVRSSRSYLYEAVDQAWNTACTQGRFATAERQNLRLATTHTTRSCCEAVDLMYQLGGGTSVYRKSRLQRLFRDMHVATQHAMVGDSVLELTGRLFLGLETNTSQL